MDLPREKKGTPTVFLSVVASILAAGVVAGGVTRFIPSDQANAGDAGKLSALEAKVSEQSAQLAALSTDVLKLTNEQQDDLVILNAAQPEFQSLQTGVGQLFVSVQDIQPYADGFKLLLHVGNPSAATLYGGEGSISWYSAGSDGTKSAQSKEFQVLKDIRAGFWTPVEVTISPAKSADLNALFVRMNFNNVKMTVGR
ncbi:MAG: hypothetical protein ABMA14_11460 [Hyphomonadaceae bacterium]